MSIQLKNDNELVQLYINGNEECLGILLNRHKRKIFSCIIVIVKDEQLAEDIFQDTFFKVIQNLKKGKYNEEGKFLPWVIRIARNLIIDHYRNLRKMPPVPIYVNDDGEEIDVFNRIATQDDVEKKDATQNFKKSIRLLMNKLHHEQREVVLMRIYYDMTFKEISEFKNIPLNTALGRMRYALINLKKMIEEHKVEVAYK